MFLSVVSNSFSAFLNSGTSRSTAKLKPLHGAIAKDLSMLLGEEYTIMSQGFETDKEGTISGRYIDKKVDITIIKEDKPIAGIAVKFIMQNYSQNSNNYFEGMLGETANIRSNNIPYFQIVIMFDQLPYYDKDGNITKWERFSEHNAFKYVVLSQDNTDIFFHTPNKTLIYIVHIPVYDDLEDKSDYIDNYTNSKTNITSANFPADYTVLGNSIIINDYESFINKVYHTIKAI